MKIDKTKLQFNKSKFLQSLDLDLDIHHRAIYFEASIANELIINNETARFTDKITDYIKDNFNVFYNTKNVKATETNPNFINIKEVFKKLSMNMLPFSSSFLNGSVENNLNVLFLVTYVIHMCERHSHNKSNLLDVLEIIYDILNPHYQDEDNISEVSSKFNDEEEVKTYYISNLIMRKFCTYMETKKYEVPIKQEFSDNKFANSIVEFLKKNIFDSAPTKSSNISDMPNFDYYAGLTIFDFFKVHTLNMIKALKVRGLTVDKDYFDSLSSDMEEISKSIMQSCSTIILNLDVISGILETYQGPITGGYFSGSQLSSMLTMKNIEEKDLYNKYANNRSKDKEKNIPFTLACSIKAGIFLSTELLLIDLERDVVMGNIKYETLSLKDVLSAYSAYIHIYCGNALLDSLIRANFTNYMDLIEHSSRYTDSILTYLYYYKKDEENNKNLSEAKKKNKELSDELSRIKNKESKEAKNTDYINELKEEIKLLQSKNNELNNQCENLRQQNNEYEEVFSSLDVSSNESENNITEEDIELINSKKICIVGGHINWQHSMQEEFPNIKFINIENTVTSIGSFDVVFIFSKYMSHSVREKIQSLCERDNTPISYINNYNRNIAIKQILDYFKNN